MKHKTTRIMLISFIVIMATATPIGYAYNWPEIPDIQLTWHSEDDWMPSIAQAWDGKIWVAWYTYRTGNEEIFYKTYDASNVHPWSPDMQLTNNANTDMAPAITQAEDGTMWVVWSSNRSGNYDLWYKVYDGVSWSSDMQLTTNPYQDKFPSIMQTSNGTIWVVWSTNRVQGDFDPYYKTSANYGATWSSEKCIFPQPPVPGDDLAPSITQVSNGDIWVAWEHNNNIYYRIYKSTTWKWDSSINPVTTDQPPNINSHPSLMRTSDGKTWVVWSTNSTFGNFEIVYKCHNGYTWESEITRLTQTYEDDKMPCVMQANDQTIWTVWLSNRAPGGYDIYYKTTAMPQLHDVAIVSITSYTTKANRGQTVSIEVVAQNLGTNAENFEVRCYGGLTLIGSEQVTLVAGRLCPIIFNWNTTGVASGKYTISAEASHVSGEAKTADNALTDGTVQIKVPGDINGDDHVNGLDAGLLTYDIWAIPGDPRWNNGRSDLNNDGIVDVEDAGIIVINFEG